MDLKIRQKNLSQEAYNKIKLLILENVLKSGEKIVQEKMAQRLGISRIPLIQALSMLQKERLLEYNPRKGFAVREISTKEFYDLLEVRGALEGLAVKIIAKRLNEPIKKRLLSFLKEFKDASKEKDINRYFYLDRKFHFYIIQAADNSYLSFINNSLNILLLCYTKGFRTNLNLSYNDHKKIINEILKGNGEEAESMMLKHLEHTKEYFN